MEAVFMQAFENRGEAEAQMRQQVEAYSQYLAWVLIDAGHLPLPWLLPHLGAVATLKHRAQAGAQMRQQVVSFSRSRARALLAAGPRPLPWLLQSPAEVATQSTQPLEDPRSIATPPPKIDSSHSVKPDILEGPNTLAGTDPASTGSTTSAVVSSEISHNDSSTASAKDAFVPPLYSCGCQHGIYCSVHIS
ncbi:hypothetical protein BS78_07G174800 [Paspalum vaginatum]|nr:hypothetical protein BS78_07G174800 [Paspalum vaginatum]KAJ1268979.1 hypothetical protein BS78_07G174800 [Paspalum vaginatum]